MRLADLYSDYFANWISNGEFLRSDTISLLGIKPSFDKYVTANSITKIWEVVSLPVEYNFNLTEQIRATMFKLHPEVKTVINMYSVPAQINIHSDYFKRNFANIADRYSKYEKAFSQLQENEQLTGVTYYEGNSARRVTINKEQLMRLKEEYDSYTYVTAAIKGGAQFAHTYYFIQASAKTKKEMRDYSRDLVSFLQGKDIYFKEVRGSVDSYLRNFGPLSYLHDTPKGAVPLLVADEGLSDLCPRHTRGLVGGRGALIGVDFRTKLPFMIDFFNSGSAQVVMLLAKSGWGKTFMAFAIALELLRKGLHVSAIDFKGDEWIKLLAFVKGIVVDVSDGSGIFVNTLRLDDLDVDSKNCEDLYNTACRGTSDIFRIATSLDPSEGNLKDLYIIMETAFEKLMSKNGVVATNPNTFKNTADLTFSDVIEMIAELKYSKIFTDEQRKVCDLLVSRCSRYFTLNGSAASAFKTELTLADVIESPLVIYSFNKNNGETLSEQDNLRTYMVQFMDGKKHSMRKKKKLHSAAFYEEIQRVGDIEPFVRDISHKVTGSRSNNLTVFLLLNAISVFQSQQFAPIRSNLTTLIVGKQETPDINLLVQDYNCYSIKDDLEAILENKGNKMQNVFAIKYDTGVDSDSTLIKTVLPKDMTEAFATRNSLNE